MIGAAFSSCQSKREDPLPSIQAVFECVNEMPIVSPPSPTQCVQGIELLLSGDSLSLSQVRFERFEFSVGRMGSQVLADSDTGCIKCLLLSLPSTVNPHQLPSFSNRFSLPSFLLLSLGISLSDRGSFAHKRIHSTDHSFQSPSLSLSDPSGYPSFGP